LQRLLWAFKLLARGLGATSTQPAGGTLKRASRSGGMFGQMTAARSWF
jgi:hypothetical protein